MPLVSINPATEREIARYDTLAPEAVESALARADAAFHRHRETLFAERAAKMRRAAETLESRADEWGALMTREMGKPITQAVAEARKCAAVCRYYAEHAEAHLADERAPVDEARAFVTYQPLGPVLAVMPWNFPFWQVFRFAAPALMAGNVGLLKHASNVTGCSLAIEEIFREAGFDGGEFQSLRISTDPVAEIIADRRVRGATVTGSEGAGRAIGGAAGKALKPSVLELGGSDAFLVLADADLDAAVETAVRSRTQNTGQSCIAAKRFIVEEKVLDDFTRRFVERMERLVVGDPMDRGTEIGPIARADLRDEIHDQVERAVADGAEVLTGGEKLDGTGFFYAPTVLGGVREGTVAFDEEIFGPVASVVAARDADDAVRLANASRFGLGSTVFTRDLERGERVARALHAGCAFVNAMVKSDPRVPFGGVGDSGYGRELAAHGIRAFTNVKTVWVGA